uniref:Spartin a n=1 Tax=Tetraodon nigroviridis TaxID=99883 RepID=H3CX29_TETNG
RVRMPDPAELLLLRDQYGQARRSLSGALAAEDAGDKAKALACYRKAQQHLVQGAEVPTNGDRQKGPAWDTARELRRRMEATLGAVNTHLSDLESSREMKSSRRDLLKDLPVGLYPDLASSSPPSQSSLNHLYPTVPAAASNNTPSARLPPPRLPYPATPQSRTVPAAATDMADPRGQPPAYTPQPTSAHLSLALQELGSGKEAGGDGHVLLFIPSGVQMFFVAPNGQVSSLSSPGYLRIITFGSPGKDSTAGSPWIFLHVCDWVYTLASDTPVLLANSGIYMFPDTLADTPGSFVGIVLSSELPAADRETFNDLLAQRVDLRIQVWLFFPLLFVFSYLCSVPSQHQQVQNTCGVNNPSHDFPGPGEAGADVVNLSEKIHLGPPEEQTELAVTTEGRKKPPLPGWSEKMGQGILSGATKMSEGLAKGAEATSRQIQKSGDRLRDRMTPEETPSNVSPHVTRGLNVARKASGGAVRVSQFLVNGVAKVAGHVAEKMAPHVKKHGSKLVPESMKKGKDGQASNLDGAKFVAVSSLQGFSTIWTSLENGAKLIGRSVSSETVMTVKHKYGDDASQATDTAIQSVANIGVAAYNFDNLAIKAIMKTSEQTAKVMVK